jgi:hypothetical protein
MDRTTLAFAVLLAVLFVGQVFVREQFANVSDNSGSFIRLSLTDLLSLIGTSTPSSTPTPSTTPIVINQGGGSDYSYYNRMKKAILGDVRQTVRDELLNGSLSAINSSGCNGDTISDSCIDSFSDQQGADFMRFIPGKNPADYIRKDSVPCYGCSVPN